MSACLRVARGLALAALGTWLAAGEARADGTIAAPSDPQGEPEPKPDATSRRKHVARDPETEAASPSASDAPEPDIDDGNGDLTERPTRPRHGKHRVGYDDDDEPPRRVRPRVYEPRSPFTKADVPCWAIPQPRCTAYPLVAFGVQGGAASTPVGWERVVRPYVQAGVMGSVGRFVDFGAGLTVAYDKLESTTAASMETQLRLRLWMPSGFFGDVFSGPAFERWAYPGTITGTRAGGVIGLAFSFSEIVGLEGTTTILTDVGGKSGMEVRYLLGARFSIPTIAFAIAGIGYALSKK